ncbi:DUF4145 domain-containing protein [Gracilibacillus sp. YIM 98692]|uniref:DUF4145 domain-containing protein n=1 Tax=Gracilibacillus sp. YIM 98692 TaxID=2663532 RepID=UPI0013D6A25A|nr:DUF4145 domain-containing protein [Gracilibacillus sp. YIM 98692]
MNLVKDQYFYAFLNDVSKELASIARELEHSVFTSPRTMLTHARVFVEGVVSRVLHLENISDSGGDGLIDRLTLLKEDGLATEEQLEALHTVRKLGNEAAHQTRAFRYSEALIVWEALYIIIKWFVEAYGSPTIQVPSYQDPANETSHTYERKELDLRFKQLEDRLVERFVAVTAVEEEVSDEKEEEPLVLPGETVIRTIYYAGQSIDIPYFLRDAFLLPQRFSRAERFMIALGGVQQARIMSELPEKIEGMSKLVKRYKEDNERYLFLDLVDFVEEERARRKIVQAHPGELFLFFKEEYLIMTERLASIPLTEAYFKGFPSFLNQMQADGINTVGHLPKELLILAKYERVGVGTVEKLFRQLSKL